MSETPEQLVGSVWQKSIHTHEQVPYKVQSVMAGDGHSVQGGDRQVLTTQQLLQKPDQGTEDAEVGRSAVGH